MTNEPEEMMCDICHEIKFAFIGIEKVNRNKQLFCDHLYVCIDCFKSKNINEILRQDLINQSKDHIIALEKKMDKYKYILEKEQSAQEKNE